MKKQIIRIIFLILIILNSLIIFGFSAQNGEKSGNLSKTITIKIADILNIEENREEFIRIGEQVIRKLAHFGIYTTLGIFSYAFITTFNIKEKIRIIIITLWGIIYASTDEIHQIFSNGRHPSINDVIIDTLGVILGILLVMLVLKIKEVIKAKNEKKIANENSEN